MGSSSYHDAEADLVSTRRDAGRVSDAEVTTILANSLVKRQAKNNRGLTLMNSSLGEELLIDAGPVGLGCYK